MDEKSNEITAIPKVLESIEIKGQVVTIDAMEPRRQLWKQYEGEGQKKGTGYKKTIEKAHGQTEIREYYQTEDISWMNQKKQWKGLKSIGMEKKTIRKLPV